MNTPSRVHYETVVMPAMSNEDLMEFALHHLCIILDDSGSMTRHQSHVYQQLLCILSALHKANQNSLDMRTLVKLAFFNKTVSIFNDTYLQPEQLADTLTVENYQCHGTTSAGAVYRFLDQELSRSNPAVRNLKKNDPGFTIVLITDAQVNDAENLRKEAHAMLESNRFYRDYCKFLVIYLGDENHKEDAIALANGDEKSVISLDSNCTALLSPIIVGSTVNFADGTHVHSCSLADIAEEAKNREAEASRSVTEMRDEDLAKLFASLMGKS